MQRYNISPSTHDYQNGSHSIGLHSGKRDSDPSFKFLGWNKMYHTLNDTVGLSAHPNSSNQLRRSHITQFHRATASRFEGTLMLL